MAVPEKLCVMHLKCTEKLREGAGPGWKYQGKGGILTLDKASEFLFGLVNIGTKMHSGGQGGEVDQGK